MRAAKRLKICIGGNYKDGAFILESCPINAHVLTAKCTRHRTASSEPRATLDEATMRFAVPKLNSVPTSAPSRSPTRHMCGI